MLLPFQGECMNRVVPGVPLRSAPGYELAAPFGAIVDGAPIGTVGLALGFVHSGHRSVHNLITNICAVFTACSLLKTSPRYCKHMWKVCIIIPRLNMVNVLLKKL
jgi:hypothetical protein